jgi:hypothetical protein
MLDECRRVRMALILEPLASRLELYVSEAQVETSKESKTVRRRLKSVEAIVECL